MGSRIPESVHPLTPVEWEAGDLATFFPHFSGPVPCRVLGRYESFYGRPSDNPKVYIVVEFTAARDAYRKGGVEMVYVDAGGGCDKLFARNRVRVSRGAYVPTYHAHSVSRLALVDRGYMFGAIGQLSDF